jgi:hypothetical protein
MALFPGVTGSMGFMGKTHTGLIVSEGDAPAEKLIVAKAEAVKFSYAYGPEGNQNVVLAKGKIVEVGLPEYEYSSSRNWPTVKTAGVDSLVSAGVNAHNVYEVKRDRFSGNRPNVITRSFIEIPLFEHGTLGTAQAYAEAMKYGAAYGVTNGLVPGDYVKVGINGNYVKLDTTNDSPFMSVGQVWAVEKELPPAGFLQYYLDLKVDEIEAWMKDSSYAPSPGVASPFSPNSNGNNLGAYPYGAPWSLHKWKGDFEKLLNPTINKGIPFLTDGYFKAKQVVTGVTLDDVYNASTNNDGVIESVVFSGAGVEFGHLVTATWTPSAANAVDKGVKTLSATRNNALFIKLRDALAGGNDLDRVETNPVVVKYNDGAAKVFAAADVHIDWTNNTIVVYLEPGVQYNTITLDLKMVVDPVAGVPTEWDHAGSVGAVRILLQK